MINKYWPWRLVRLPVFCEFRLSLRLHARCMYSRVFPFAGLSALLSMFPHCDDVSSTVLALIWSSIVLGLSIHATFPAESDWGVDTSFGKILVAVIPIEIVSISTM